MIVHSNDTRRLVNVSDDRGFTPLMNATIGESESAMNLLINHGADGTKPAFLCTIKYLKITSHV